MRRRPPTSRPAERYYVPLILLILAVVGMACACGNGTPSPHVAPTLTSTVPLSTAPFTASPPHTTLMPTQSVPPETTARQLRVFTQLWEAVRDTYVYPDFNGLDWDALYRRYHARIEAGMEDEIFYQAMREMIGELGDGHSAFNSPQEAAAEEELVSGQLDYVGIGVYLTVLLDKGYAVLLQVFPASPAEQAGLLPHDRILTIDGAPVVDEHQGNQIDLLSGLASSDVRITVQTPGQGPRELVVERARIQTQLLVDAYRLPGTDIGYLLIPSFLDRTMADRVRQALESLMAAGELEGLIVDMRINGGGLDTELRDTLSIFTAGELGAFVSRATERPLVVEANPIGNSHEIPLVLLVGRETESFGEIFGGVLQEQGRALLVGRTTDGNVETLWQVDLEDGSRAWIACETFRPPSGTDWEQSGIVPDIEILLDWDEFTVQDDPQLQAAADWLRQAAGD